MIGMKTHFGMSLGGLGVHKGIDIFGQVGTGVIAATDGIVIYEGWLKRVEKL